VIFVINHRREIKELEKLMKECLDKNDVGWYLLNRNYKYRNQEKYLEEIIEFGILCKKNIIKADWADL
jgi:hypothetical protein